MNQDIEYNGLYTFKPDWKLRINRKFSIVFLRGNIEFTDLMNIIQNQQ